MTYMADDKAEKRQTPQQKWTAEIEAAEKNIKKFQTRARSVTRRYIDERDPMNTTNKWFNIFYANINIMEAALYSNIPKPVVARKFKDYNDDVARVAGLIIERTITQDLDDPRDTYDATMRHCVQDRLIPGLSQAWLRLETDTEDIELSEDVTAQPGMETEEVGEAPETQLPAEQPEPLKRITDQRICVDYVFWEDFLWSPCRIWDERRWVARRVYMTREELCERFGEEKGRLVSMETRNSANGNTDNLRNVPKEEVLKKAEVWEIWVREDRKVIWYSPNSPSILEEADDPLQLVGFEPCPTPMLANITTSNTVPRPDFYMIQDQYNELDTINNRISLLVQACKVVGVYDKSAIGVQRMLQEGSDNLLIPVDNWAMFAEKQGLKGQIDWLPLDTVVQSLQHLNNAREVIKAQIYELTGISDIVRGASKASETLGAQQIKAQFAGIRIKKLQDEIARFAGDILRIKAEMQIKHFDPEIMLKKSNIMATGNDQYVQQAMELLQNEQEFEWRITVSADSIAQADYQSEKTDRVEAITAISGYIEKAGALIAQSPGSAPLLINILKWGISSFRNTQEIEGMLDKELDALAQPKPPAQPPPDPEAQKMQMEMQMAQQQAQMEAQAAQMDMQLKQQLGQMEIQMKQMELRFEEQRLEFERQKLGMGLQMEQQRMALESQQSAEKLANDRESAQIKIDAQRESAAIAAASKREGPSNGS